MNTVKRRIRGNHVARFWSKVQKTNDCWLWIGPTWGFGYGRFKIGHKYGQAHRYSFQLANPGRAIEDLWVLHHCDNPLCVNPAHLFLGTRQDNMDDMKAKGRGNNAHRGITHCKHGHPFDEQNTYTTSRGARQCRICKAKTLKEWKASNRLMQGAR